MISARAVAVQGFGYGPLLTSVQGLLGIVSLVPPLSGAVGPPYHRFAVRTRRRDDDEELFLILSIWLQVCEP